MWVLIWLGLVMLLTAFWIAPDYWERNIYPRLRLDTRVSRDFADPGDTVELRIRLTNPSRLPCPRIRLEFQLPEELAVLGGEGERKVALETYLLPRQSVELIVTAVAVRRGVARWNQALLECTDMFGLRRTFRTVYPQMQVIIRPNRLVPLPDRRLMNGLMGDIRVRRFIQEDPSLFTGVRPYQSGDPMRTVSWHATARTGGLMVKQFGHTTEARILLVLNGQMGKDHWVPASRDRLDRLCEHVLQLAMGLSREQMEVGFMTNLSDSLGGHTEVPPASGKVQPERIANKLGSLSRYTASSQAELLRTVGRAVRPGDTVVLVTDYQDEESAQVLMQLRQSRCPVHMLQPDGAADEGTDNPAGEPEESLAGGGRV